MMSHQLQESAETPRAQPADARSTLVCLLPVGRAAIEKGAPGHVADVRRNFIDLLTPAELDLLATLNERTLQHLAKNYDSPPKTSLHRPRRPQGIQPGRRSP
jgi:hypothetical protein